MVDLVLSFRHRTGLRIGEHKIQISDLEGKMTTLSDKEPEDYK